MLTCITCSSKKRAEEEGDGAVARESETPTNTKEGVKSLTAQIKDMALKLSGAYKQCTGSGSLAKGSPYPMTGSSTPAWDLTTPRDDENENENEAPKEWMAQVEPGVHITFMPLPNGGNDLKRIRFSREMFDKWQAQRWWGDNYEKIKELYNVERFNHQALNTPIRPQDERQQATSMDVSTSSSVSISNVSEAESEWVEQDEPGVYITIRQLADGTRELRRVRFSREIFGEMNAKQWWAENRERVQQQYL